jgi:hypothetical protein
MHCTEDLMSFLEKFPCIKKGKMDEEVSCMVAESNLQDLIFVMLSRIKIMCKNIQFYEHVISS